MRAVGETRAADARLRARRRRQRRPHARARARGRARGRARWATLVPHFYPPPAPGVPPYGLGAMAAAHARSAARSGGPPRSPMSRGVERGRRELNETRRRVGLPALARALRRDQRPSCASSAPSRSSSTRARGRRGVHVTGPLVWEPPGGDVEWPPGDGPLRAGRAEHLAGPGPDACCAPRSRASPACRCGCSRPAAARAPTRPARVPANARLVEWVSYAQAMPRADLVVCHGGHGTLATALRTGRPGRDGARPPATWPRTARARSGRARASTCPGASSSADHAALGGPARARAPGLRARAQRARGLGAHARRRGDGREARRALRRRSRS